MLDLVLSDTVSTENVPSCLVLLHETGRSNSSLLFPLFGIHVSRKIQPQVRENLNGIKNA